MKRFNTILLFVSYLVAAGFVIALFTGWPENKSNAGGNTVTTDTAAPATASPGTSPPGTDAGTTAATNGGGTATTAAATTAPATTAKANNVDGKKVYADQCAVCHGGDGGGGVGPSLKGEQNKRSEAEETKIVTDGQNLMPGFKGQLSADQIAAVVAYTRTLG